ncbi:ATP-binding protein [Oceanibaculum pacificum]|uniref:Histidine kinase/HSP90-like ATPase domain-containing protein n=1 Tax=Oceanibaculum pacificum TaxID=580166 RepID=A0A154VZL4_9PROT|nr:ATP-binding protein [Oceanibaculum pacificum]KZD06784.1 hypothetical protein AUP43_10625 [Oceanibaculum pacificum]
MAERIDISIPNDREAIPAIVGELERLTEIAGLAPDAAYALELAVDELVTNIISYGYPAGGQGTIQIVVEADAAQLRLEIVDDGVPFDPLTQERDPPLDGEIEDRPIGGLGIHLVQSLMDEMRYERSGDRNRIFCVKRR